MKESDSTTLSSSFFMQTQTQTPIHRSRPIANIEHNNVMFVNIIPTTFKNKTYIPFLPYRHHRRIRPVPFDLSYIYAYAHML